MSGPTKEQLQVSLTMVRAELEQVDKEATAETGRLRDLVNKVRTAQRHTEALLVAAQKDVAEARHGWTQAQASADEQFRYTREMRERAELAESTLKETLDELDLRRREFLAAAHDASDAKERVDELSAQLRLEKQRAADLLLSYNDMGSKWAACTSELEVVSGQLDRITEAYDGLDNDHQNCEAELTRTVQTSHDREAALHDLVIAVTRSKP